MVLMPADDGLTAYFDGDGDDEDKDDNHTDAAIERVISQIECALNKDNFYGKSRLTKRNIRGLVRALSIQRFLKTRYGFRIHTLDVLIMSKTQWIISLDGAGRKEVQDTIAAGTPKLDVRTGLDISAGDKLFGGGGSVR